MFVGLIILDGNTEFCWDAALRALLLIEEDAFEYVCCKKAAFVVDDPFRNILSYFASVLWWIMKSSGLVKVSETISVQNYC